MSAREGILVTVYLLNHNYARYLDQAIQSVLSQTLQDFELIIIDDGSTDSSRDIIETVAHHDKVITVYQMNKGLATSNNIAMRMARGKYIIRLDADDYFHPEALQALAEVLESDASAGLVFPDYFEVDEDGAVLAEIKRHDFNEVTLLDQPAHGACTMIRKSCLEEVGGYDEAFGCQDGFDLWIRFIEQYGVRNINRPLFHYRRHERNLTGDESRILDTRAEILKRAADRRSSRLNVAAIIAVRGDVIDPGSPALRPLGGRPLMDWTIEAALNATRVDTVIVSSPQSSLLDGISSRWDDKVFTVHRDESLARMNTPITSTLIHALEAFERDHPRIDAVLQMAVETPFRKPTQLDSAISMMTLFDVDAVIGVRADTDNYYRHAGAGLVPLRKTETLRLEREQLYREVGQMRLLKRHLVEAGTGLEGARIGHVVIDRCTEITLRSAFDWEIAEFYASNGAMGKP